MFYFIGFTNLIFVALIELCDVIYYLPIYYVSVDI